MTNWFIPLLLLIAVIYHTPPMDPTIAPRLMAQCGFLALMVGYFGFYRKGTLQFPQVRLNQYVLMVGGALATWGVICSVTATTPAQALHVIIRDFLNLAVILLGFNMARREPQLLERLFQVMVLVAIYHSIVGIGQQFKVAFTDIPGVKEVYGYMVNPNMYGSHQALTLPFVLYVFFTKEGIWRWLSGIAIPLVLYAVIISLTRSAWVGVFATLILVNIGFFLYKNSFSEAQRSFWLKANGGFVAAALLVGLALSQTPQGSKVLKTARNKITSVSQTLAGETEKGSANFRLVVARETMDMIKDFPVFGVGPGNWALHIPVYGAKSVYSHETGVVRMRAHNDYLQTGGERGVLGLCLFLGFWVLAFFLSIRLILRLVTQPKQPANSPTAPVFMGLALLSVLTSFSLDMLFSFPYERVEHTLYMFTVLGIILGLYEWSHQEGGSEQKEATGNPYILPVLLLITFILNGIMGKIRYDFESKMEQAIIYNSRTDNQNILGNALPGKSEFIKVGPAGEPMELYTGLAYKRMQDYNKSLQELEKGYQYHPYSFRVLNTLGNVYTESSQFEKAIEFYEKARQLTPRYPAILKNLGVNYFNIQNYQKAIEMFDQTDISGDATLQQIYQASKARVNAGN